MVYPMDDDIEQSENISNSDANKTDPLTENYVTNILNVCPTQDCKDCTGSISNDVFRHRFVCMCPCHVIGNKKMNMERKI